MRSRQLTLLYSVIGLITVISGWLYVNKFLYKSKAAGSANGVTIEYTQPTGSAAVNTNLQTTLTVTPNTATEQISAAELTLKSSGVLQFVDIVPAPTFTNFDELKKTVSATSINIAYINKDLAVRPSFLITYKGTAAGTGSITVDTAASQVVGSVSTIAFLLDNIVAPNITFGTATAQDSDVAVTFNPATQTFPENSEQTVTVNIAPSNSTYQISAFNLIFTASGSVEFANVSMPTGYDAASQLIREVTPQRIRIAHASQSTKASTSVTITLNAKTAGTGTIAFDSANSQIVGTLPASEFTIAAVTNGTYTVGAGGGGGGTTITPPTATPVTGGGGGVTVSPTTGTGGGSVTTAPTSSVPGNKDVKVKIRCRFQGRHHGRGHRRRRFIRVTFEGTSRMDRVVEVKENDNGDWTGEFSTLARPGNDNAVYVKGQQHLRRKFCTSGAQMRQEETCAQGMIEIKEGENVIDMTGTLLLAGDVVPQDGVVDAYDLSVVRRLLGKKDENSLTIADLNDDGIVDSQDMSMVVQSLRYKFDDDAAFRVGVGTQQGTLIDQF